MPTSWLLLGRKTSMPNGYMAYSMKIKRPLSTRRDSVLLLFAALTGIYYILRHGRADTPTNTLPIHQTSQTENAKHTPKQSFIIKVLSAARSVVIYLTMLLLLSTSIAEVMSTPLIIEPVSVPTSIEQNGYSGRVIALQIVDHMDTIARLAKTKMSRPEYLVSWAGQRLDTHILDTGVSLSSAIDALRRLLGRHENHLSCEIVRFADGSQHFTARLTGYEPLSFEAPGYDITAATAKVAEYVYEKERPFILAAYYYSLADRSPLYHQRCIVVLRNILLHPPSTDNIYALNMLALVKETDDLKLAEQLYSSAIIFNCPTENCVPRGLRSAPLANRGLLRLRLGRINEAVKDLKAAIREDDSNARIFSYLGYALAAAGRSNDALESYRDALKIDPNCVSAYVNRGLLYARMNQLTKAIEDFTAAIQRQPNLALAYKNRAFARRQTGETQLAEEDEALVRDLAPELTYSETSLGQSSYRP
jgi:tetratricopeptide (TPR) repeat protein